MKSKVLFVCMGNICRSPTAQGVFQHLASEAGFGDNIGVSSAGTHSHHLGKSPDPRAIAAAARRGYDLNSLRAKQVRSEDFRENDIILAMDWDTMNLLQQQCPRQYSHKIQLMMRFATEHDEATVPDPYYGGPDGFDLVLNYIEDSCRGLLAVVKKRVASAVLA